MWARCCSLHHPDVSGSPKSAETFQRITAALETLSDSEARRQYDAANGGASTYCPFSEPQPVRKPNRRLGAGVQPDFVYGIIDPAGGEVPLRALTESELRGRAAHLDARLRTASADLASLHAGSNAGGARADQLRTL